ncbi:MAG: TetR/AcrR family transcriptional regulator [Salinisphaeraceae bacterium]
MPRTREFDRAAVLDKAMHAFWEGGYRATSLDHLLAATGLSKSSLYDTFGGKQALLLECLDAYARQLFAGPIEPLLRAGATFDDIREVFTRILAHAATPAGRRGCLANTCMGELGGSDAAVSAATGAIVERIESGFAAAVATAQARGEITNPESPAVLARFLFNTLSGLNLAARAGASHDRLQDIVRVTLDALAPAPAVAHTE